MSAPHEQDAAVRQEVLKDDEVEEGSVRVGFELDDLTSNHCLARLHVAQRLHHLR
jgi:hypothetical protein